MNRLVVVAAVLFTESGMAGPRLELLREEDVDYGCGCGFELLSAKESKPEMVLQWEFGGPANIRVDGRLRRLKVETKQSELLSKRPWKIGDKEQFYLQGEGITGAAICTVIRACNPEQPSCEVADFSAVLTVRTAEGTATFKTKATCGC